MSPRRSGCLAAAALWAAGAAGCVLPALQTKAGGSPVGRGDAVEIAAGATTRAQLIERLGAPMAIAGPGEVIHVPAANVHHVSEMAHRTTWFGGGAFAQQGDAWLEAFAARRPLRDSHRVWYWYETAEGGITVFLVVGLSSRWATTRELWVLVDEATGIAEDALYRER